MLYRPLRVLLGFMIVVSVCVSPLSLFGSVGAASASGGSPSCNVTLSGTTQTGFANVNGAVSSPVGFSGSCENWGPGQSYIQIFVIYNGESYSNVIQKDTGTWGSSFSFSYTAGATPLVDDGTENIAATGYAPDADSGWNVPEVQSYGVGYSYVTNYGTVASRWGSPTSPPGGPIVAPERSGGGGGVDPGACDCGTGDPIDIATGDFIQSATDASIPTFGPALMFTRTYDSGVAQQEAATSSPGPLGYGWTDNWATSLLLNTDYYTSVSGDVTFQQANGSEALFVPPVSGSCVSPYVGPGTSNTFCALPQVLGSLTYNSGSSTYTLLKFRAPHSRSTRVVNSPRSRTPTASARP